MNLDDVQLPQAPFTLVGKTAVVTGGGRGIGKAIVGRLASSGANVVVADKDREALEEARSSVRGPGQVALICGDLMDPDHPQQIVDTALKTFQAIDIVVNCAGFSWDSVIQKTSDEQLLAMLNIHVVAPFRVLRAAKETVSDIPEPS